MKQCFTVKWSTVFVVYLIASAWVMGSINQWLKYRCPNESNGNQMGIVVTAGALWPAAIALGLIGYKPSKSNLCLDHTPIRKIEP